MSESDLHRPFIDLLDRVAIFARVDPIVYGRIRARLDHLRQWYTDRTGWSVVCTRELARLVKTPAAPGAGHGFAWAQQPLDYELFTWILWYAEASGAEAFLLTHMVTEIESRANEVVGQGHLDWDNYAHRLSLNRALKGLEAMGAIHRLDGSSEQWAQDRSGDTLYELTPLLRYLYLEPGLTDWASGGGSHSGAEATLSAAAAPSRRLSPSQRLYRTLLLCPALYAARDPEAFALLGARDRRHRIAADLREHFGWDLEVTEAYAALLRPSASETSLQYLFPFRGARSQVLLLLFGELQQMVRAGELPCDAQDRVRLARTRLVSIISTLHDRFAEQWGKTVGRMSGISLGEEIIELLAEWDLLEGPDRDDQVYVMPLAARFRGMYEEA